MKQGGYGGRVRYILKDTIKFVPLYGWYLGHVRQDNLPYLTLVVVQCVWGGGPSLSFPGFRGHIPGFRGHIPGFRGHLPRFGGHISLEGLGDMMM